MGKEIIILLKNSRNRVLFLYPNSRKKYRKKVQKALLFINVYDKIKLINGNDLNCEGGFAIYD
jgi:hypothetical protein